MSSNVEGYNNHFDLQTRYAPRAMVAIFILLLLVIIGPMISAERIYTGEGNPFRQLSYLVLFGFTIIALRIDRRPLETFMIPLGIVLALAWCWMSISWSLAPAVAGRRLLLTTIIIMTIFATVRAAGFSNTVGIVRFFLALVLVANYIAIAFFPSAVHPIADIGDLSLAGDWRGIFPQKNFTGAVCAFTIIFYLLGPQRISIAWRLMVVAASGYYLYRTRSKTSMGILVMAMIGGWAYIKYSPRLRSLVIPAISVAGAVAVLVGQGYVGKLLAPFSQANALTGRVQIWPVLVAYAKDHWLLGSGYGSFWNIGSGSPVYRYAQSWVELITSGHNGYLDVLVQLGIPGLLLIVFGSIIWPAGKLLASEQIPRSEGALLTGVLTFCVGHNLTETSLFERDAIVEVFMMIAIALIYISGKPRSIDTAIHRPRVA